MDGGFVFGLFVAPIAVGALSGWVYWLAAGRPSARSQKKT
jgi:hypothetical protein